MPTFKVWNAGRDIRKTVQADSVAELCAKGGQKLGLQGPLRIVLKTDGTEIEDDAVLLDPRGFCSGTDIVLILLQPNENWNRMLTKQRPKELPSYSVSGADHLLSIFSIHSARLRNIIDPDFGLLEELLKVGLLSDESYANVRKGDTYFKRNDYLMRYMKRKTKEEELQGFLDALRNTDQSHVVNYMLANGEHLEMCYGSEHPLGAEEINHLRANGPFLLSNVIVNEEFLAALLASKCITLEHHEHVKAQTTSNKRVVELMVILKRRSVTALKKFVHSLYETRQKIVADVLSEPGVAVPTHVNVTASRSTRDVKALEEDLAIKLMEFAKTLSEETGNLDKKRKHYEKIKDLWLEMELNEIRYVSSKRGNSVAVFLWCRNGRAMSRLCEMQYSGNLRFLLEHTMQLLVDEDEELSFSLKIVEREWKLAELYFQNLGSHAEFAEPSPFMKLPKELLEIILMKSLLSFYNATWKLFPFTNFDPYSVMTCVCRSWEELMTERQWFKNTAKSHLAKNKIVQRNSVLDILPKEIVEMILIRSLLSAVHIPWQNSFSVMPYTTVLMMSSVCKQWSDLLSRRPWFTSTLKSYLKWNKHIATLQEHPLIFDQCLDVDYYFLYEMHSHSLLSEEQLLEIGSEADRLKQTQHLYRNVFLKFNAESYAQFLKVLQSTGQSHIGGFLEAKGVIDPAEHDERPLSDEEKNRYDIIQPRLTDFIPSDDFLDALDYCGCITKTQTKLVSSLPSNLKLSELLEILRRKSYATLLQFAAHLRKIDNCADIAEILNTGVTSATSETREEVKNSHAAVQQFSQEHDSKAIEHALAEKLVKVVRFIESGGTITIQDLNEIRSLWMHLERLQRVSDSTDIETELCRDKDSPERNDSCYVDDYDDEETKESHWTADENTDIYSSCIPGKKLSFQCETETHNYQNVSKLKKSQSYTYGLNKTCKEAVYCLIEFLTAIQTQTQKGQDGKSHSLNADDMKTEKIKETKAHCCLNIQVEPSLLKKLQSIIYYYNTGQEFLSSLSDIEVVYTRSKSVESFHRQT